jgi:hypothetical protein
LNLHLFDLATLARSIGSFARPTGASEPRLTDFFCTYPRLLGDNLQVCGEQAISYIFSEEKEKK